MEAPRPYWHTDAKWVFGILFFLALSASSLLFILATLTSREVAIPVATKIVAAQFSRNGLDDARDVDKVKQEFLRSGKQMYFPFPENADVSVSRQDVETLSPRELRYTIFRQVVTPIYDQGTSGNALSSYGALAVINADTHALLMRLFLFSLVPLVLFLAGFVRFSYRYGRLLNPGILLVIVNTPMALLFFLLGHTSPPEGDNGPLSAIPREVFTDIAPLATLFNFYVAGGVILIIAAIVTKLITGPVHHTTDDTRKT